MRTSFGPPWHGVTERAVFGPLDPNELVEGVVSECRRAFGVGVRDGFLYEVSSGVVIGCELKDGRRIVLKGHQPRWSAPFLAAVRHVQRALYADGYPCAAPIDEIITVGSAAMSVESELADPGIGPATDAARRGLATGLADLVERCRRIDAPGLDEHPLRQRSATVFPEPHSPIFDFEATSEGAEWIDEIASVARSIVDGDTSDVVIAHTDWCLRNVRLDGSGVVAVYDWDSLALLRETEAVALAAATWPKTGQPDDPTPTIADVDRYADIYEQRRGTMFTPMQRRATRAAAVASMAYTARCEHAIDPQEQIWTTTRPQLRSAAAVLD